VSLKCMVQCARKNVMDSVAEMAHATVILDTVRAFLVATDQFVRNVHLIAMGSAIRTMVNVRTAPLEKPAPCARQTAQSTAAVESAHKMLMSNKESVTSVMIVDQFVLGDVRWVGMDLNVRKSALQIQQKNMDALKRMGLPCNANPTTGVKSATRYALIIVTQLD